MDKTIWLTFCRRHVHINVQRKIMHFDSKFTWDHSVITDCHRRRTITWPNNHPDFRCYMARTQKQQNKQKAVRYLLTNVCTEVANHLDAYTIVIPCLFSFHLQVDLKFHKSNDKQDKIWIGTPCLTRALHVLQMTWQSIVLCMRRLLHKHVKWFRTPDIQGWTNKYAGIFMQTWFSVVIDLGMSSFYIVQAFFCILEIHNSDQTK